MSNILWVVPIIATATLWLYFLTCYTPEVAKETELHFPTSIAELKEVALLLESYYRANRFYVMLLFCSAYLYKQAFIIPGSVFMNVLAGALFGVVGGFALCCTLTAVGATCCYLISRAFAASVVHQYFPAQIKFIKDKVALSGGGGQLLYYLLFLRLLPVTPNWLINLVSPHTGVPLHLFTLTVFIGLMPYNLVCTQAGAVLGTVRSMDDVLSVGTLLRLAAMAAAALAPALLLPTPKTTPHTDKIS